MSGQGPTHTIRYPDGVYQLDHHDPAFAQLSAAYPLAHELRTRAGLEEALRAESEIEPVNLGRHARHLIHEGGRSPGAVREWGAIRLFDRFYIEHIEGALVVVKDGMWSDKQWARFARPAVDAPWPEEQLAIALRLESDQETIAALAGFAKLHHGGGIEAVGHDSDAMTPLRRLLRNIGYSLQRPEADTSSLSSDVTIEYWLFRDEEFGLSTLHLLIHNHHESDFRGTWKELSGIAPAWTELRIPYYRGPHFDSLPPGLREQILSTLEMHPSMRFIVAERPPSAHPWEVDVRVWRAGSNPELHISVREENRNFAISVWGAVPPNPLTAFGVDDESLGDYHEEFV